MRYLLFIATVFSTFILCGGNVQLPPVSQWQWLYFAEPDIPAGLFDASEKVGDKLMLPDKRTIVGRKFDFPASGIINLYTIISPNPAVLARTVVTANFQSTQTGTAVIGAGVDWKFKLYANGEVVYDTTAFGNGEAPISYNDHMIEFDVKAGDNQLIWELYGGDASFDFAVANRNIAPLEMRFQPWVTFPDSADNAVSIVFAANRPTPAGVDFRKKGTEKFQRVYNNLGGQIRRDSDIHHIRIDGLEPDCEYEYRVVLIDELRRHTEKAQPEIYSFRTLPSEKSRRAVSFIATSDLQVNVEKRREFMNRLLQSPDGQAMDFFAFVGDVDWTSNFDKAIVENFINIFRNAVNNTKPLVMVRGNHEMYGKDTNRYFKYFPAPANGNEGYYMFRCGEVCFLVLDFGDDTPRCASPSTRVLHDIEPYLRKERRWLAKAVKSPEFQSAKYRVVLAHAVPLGDSLEFMPGNVRKVIDSLLTSTDPAQRIHLWIGGHVHRPFRSIPGQNSCRTVVPVKEFNAKFRHPAVGEKYQFPVVIMGGPNRKVADDLQLTSLKVVADEKNMSVEHFDANGKLFDRITIAPDGSVQEQYSADFFKVDNY